MTLRERKRELTRDALFEAAVALFVERGYDETTMDEIAERAMVSRATAFNYFPRKEDLLTEWAQRRRAVIVTNARQAARRGEVPQIRQMLLALCGSYTRGKAGRTFVAAWLATGGPLKAEAWASAPLLADLVRAGQTAGEIRADVDAELVGRLLLNAFLGALYQWAAQQRPGTWLRRELDAALEVILAGVAASPDDAGQFRGVAVKRANASRSSS